jgi:osmotically-inducible protein OsmY
MAADSTRGASRSSDEEPPHYLVQRVREAFAHDERVGELELGVRVQGHRVFVTGTVATDGRRDAIDDVLRSVVPECEAHNETTVATLEEPKEVERLS